MSGGFEHLCFFPGMLKAGGVGRVVVNFTKELTDRGLRIDLFLTRKTGVYVSDIPSGVKVYEGGGSAAASLLPFARYLRRERPDALYAARPYLNVTALLARKIARVDTQVIASEHAHFVPGRGLRRLRQAVVTWALRLLYPEADQLVAVSRGVAREMSRRSRIPEDRIRVLHNPVMSDALVERAQDPPDHPWFRGNERVVIGVGRLVGVKDFGTLIEAFARVGRRRDVKLVILGEGEERRELEALMRRLQLEGVVGLPGHVDHPIAYMARASVVVLSSLREGFSNVLVEAMAVGTPVVATNVPGGPAEILDEGRFGPLVPPGDRDALAAAITRMLDDPPDGAVLRARARTFSVQAAADELLALLSDAS